MAELEYYDVNEVRKYPFVAINAITLAGPIVVADNTVLDCGFSMGPLSDFHAGVSDGNPTNIIYLIGVERIDEIYMDFVFSADSTQMAGRDIRFRRAKDDPYGCTTFSEFTGGPNYGSGFLVTGNVISLFDALPEGSFVGFAGDIPVIEPSCLTVRRGHGMTKLIIGNLGRTIAPNCCDESPAAPIDGVHVVHEGLTGAITLAGGYNMTTAVTPSRNSIVIQAAVGAGLGEPCSEITNYEGEESPGLAMSGGPWCGDLITTINGKPASDNGVVAIYGERGIVATPDPANHKINILASLSNTIACEE